MNNISHSVRARLLNIARDNNIPYQQLITRYFQERILSRLSKSSFRDNFILKGGALLYAYKGEFSRPTLDLDFMGENISREKETLVSAFQEIFRGVSEDGVMFDEESLKVEDITVENKYPGVRIEILGTMGSVRQYVSIDICFGDIIIPSPQDLSFPTLLDKQEINIKSYTLETVVAEKLQTMTDRYVNNSRMKDFYDVWMLINTPLDNKILRKAIQTTFQNRYTDISRLRSIFEEDFIKNEILQKRWEVFCKKLKREFPSFETMMTEIRNYLYPFGL